MKLKTGESGVIRNNEDISLLQNVVVIVVIYTPRTDCYVMVEYEITVCCLSLLQQIFCTKKPTDLSETIERALKYIYIYFLDLKCLLKGVPPYFYLTLK